MEVIPLQSGSSGNCIYVESGDVRLLFDAGISGRKAEMRLAKHGKDIRDVNALVISHDHGDHTQCMGVFNRKYQLPIYISRPTLKSVQRSPKQGKLSQLNFFKSAQTFRVGHVSIETLPTPHDSVDSVAFVIDDGEKRFGLLTDLGHVFSELRTVIGTLDAVLLESNYDPAMLIDAPYPEMLKTRIEGPRGHISNDDAAELLNLASDQLQWAVLAHLSAESNTPEKALRTHERIVKRDLEIRCADRNDVSSRMLIRPALQRPTAKQTAAGRMVQPQLFS